MEALLALEDGRVFRGRAEGALAGAVGEVVFNTSMSGYQEILTDPSYRGQIVVMTAPEIGNYGTNPDDQESAGPQVAGFATRELSTFPSNWRATQGLHQYLKEHAIPCITELDTRALTRHIRTRGALRGALGSGATGQALVERARSAPRLEEQDLVGQVTCAEPYRWSQPRPRRWVDRPIAAAAGRPRCVAFDFGTKRNILRLLCESGFDVTVVPATTEADDVLAMQPDAVFLSNGPGDPAAATYAVATIGELVGRVPMFGICLGHQIAALAIGGRTFKLKFGHRGGNHPVQELATGKVAVTSQNHGYAVDTATLPDGVEVTHLNLNDGTCEGFVDRERRLMAIQYHPESSPGPHDAVGLFTDFRRFVGGEGR